MPLVGFAGQISLCQLSFAGIGAVVMAHLGHGGDPLALVWAVLIAAAVGALVALPALRLSGIYLALGTAAFAVTLDRWVFTLPKFSRVRPLRRRTSSRPGSVDVDPLKLFGNTFDDPGVADGARRGRASRSSRCSSSRSAAAGSVAACSR